MSWTNYAVFPKNKILVPIGRKNQEQFERDVKDFEDFMEFIDELDYEMLDDKKPRDLNIHDLTIMVRLFKMALNLKDMCLFDVFLGYMVGSDQIKVISEIEAFEPPYKAYRRISLHDFE